MPNYRSREEHAAFVLRGMGLEVDLHPTAGGASLFCYDPRRPIPIPDDGGAYDERLRPGLMPNAIVGREPYPGKGMPAWGALAPDKLQRRILAVLNTGAV